MILVDSSVRIDFFRGKDTPQVERLDALFAQERIAVGDLIVTEVLQGFRSERDFNRARKDPWKRSSCSTSVALTSP